MKRGYQNNFSDNSEEMFQKSIRQKKAKTMVAVLNDFLLQDLSQLSLINVGGSTGFIDEYLSHHFFSVTGIDIDEKAIEYAKRHFKKNNLKFEVGDAMNINYNDNSFDIAICSQVYEHVPDANKLLDELYRVLKPGGLVYFAAGNRLMFNEPHHNLPLLSVIPRPLAHIYMKITKKGSYYYEKHLTYWGLKKLTKKFTIIDYTSKIICNPEKFHASYMLKPKSAKHNIAIFITRYLFWLVPAYIWLLKKPE